MFYAISKRRRDINAAEARGREIGWKKGFEIGLREGWKEGFEIGLREGREIAWKEGFEIGRIEILEAMAARLRAEPDANPMDIIAELRAQFPNRPRQQVA